MVRATIAQVVCRYVARPQSKVPTRPTASKPYSARSDCACVIEQCCSMANALTVLPAFSQSQRCSCWRWRLYSSSRRLWSAVSDKVSECTEHGFTITELSSHFPQISRSLLHEIGTEHLLLRKLCARWVPKQMTPEHSIQKLVPRYNKCLNSGGEYVEKKQNTCCICCNKYVHAILFCFCTRPQGNLLCGWASYKVP
jgi:hypothetical protein